MYERVSYCYCTRDLVAWAQILDLRAPEQLTHLAVSVLHEFLYTIKQITDQQLLSTERINYHALY